MTEQQKSEQPFDFEAHRRDAISQYQDVRPSYEDFSEVVRTILSEAIRDIEAKVASVEARAKALESFGDKSATPTDGDPETPKYPNPLADIEDLAAARVITFFLKDIDTIDGIISNEFEILERADKSDLLLEDVLVGYQSIHYIVKLQPNRTSLPEYARYAGLRAEIQLRTVLQHAWAEIEHDIQYKSAETIPVAIRRRFISLAGLLEIADREFQAVQAEDERLRQEARLSVERGNLEQVEITGDALKAYLDGKLGADGRMKGFVYEWTARMLRRLGFSNFRQIEQATAPYDDDAVSRALHGYRQGQLTRFEDMLLVSMGQVFIERSFGGDAQWWRRWKQILLDRAHHAGLTTGSYVPVPETGLVSPDVEA